MRAKYLLAGHWKELCMSHFFWVTISSFPSLWNGKAQWEKLEPSFKGKILECCFHVGERSGNWPVGEAIISVNLLYLTHCLPCASGLILSFKKWVSAHSSPLFPCFLFLSFYSWDYTHRKGEETREVDKGATCTSLMTSVLSPEPTFYTKGWWGDMHLNFNNSVARWEMEANASNLKDFRGRVELQTQKAWLLYPHS